MFASLWWWKKGSVNCAVVLGVNTSTCICLHFIHILSRSVYLGGETRPHVVPVEDWSPWAKRESLRDETLEWSPGDQHAAWTCGSPLPGLEEKGWGELFVSKAFTLIGSVCFSSSLTTMLMWPVPGVVQSVLWWDWSHVRLHPQLLWLLHRREH